MTAWNKGLHIYLGGRRFVKGQRALEHKQNCKCFRCDREHWIVSPETIKKITDSNRGQIRLNMRGENNPSWKGGLPKCEICQKKLGSYRAKQCRDHYVLRGERNWSWKGGKSKCQSCGKVRGDWSKERKWCKPCSVKLQRHSGPDWSKYKHPFLGKHHTRETKAKISNKNKGMKMSEETKKKMSIWRRTNTEKMREAWVKGIEKNKNFKGPTSIEKKVYEELKKRGLLFEKQYLVNSKFLVDAYIPSLHLIIEADGDYWHSLPKVQKKDKAENAYLQKCGYKLLRLSEREINSKDWSLPIN